MYIQKALSGKPIESIEYLFEQCPNQAEFHRTIKEISSSSLRKNASIASQKTESTPPLNQIVKEWRCLLDRAARKEPEGRPLLGMKLIQILQLGSYKGWFTQPILNKIHSILCECKFYHKTGRPKKSYNILSLLYQHLESEVAHALPYFPKRFAYIINRYCRKHYAALKELSLDNSVIVQEKPKISLPPWNFKRKTFIWNKIEEIFRDHVIKHYPNESINLAVSKVFRQIADIFMSSGSLKYPRYFKMETDDLICPVRSLFCCSLNLTPDNQFLDLQVTNRSFTPYSTGGTKSLYRAQRFFVPLEESKSIEMNHEVFLRPKDNRLDFCYALRANYEVTERIKDLLPNIPLVPRRYYGEVNLLKRKGDPSKATEPWCNTDLYKAKMEKSIPQNFIDSSSAKPISLKDLLDVVFVRANDLAKVHGIGLIHGDVKGANILLNSEGLSYLTDWDLASGYDADLFSHEYQYWDKFRKRGIATPFTDWWGLTMTGAELTIPDYSKIYTRIFVCDSNNRVSNNILKPFLARIPSKKALFSLRHHLGLLESWEKPFPLCKASIKLCNSSMQTYPSPASQTENIEVQGVVAIKRLQDLCDRVLECLQEEKSLSESTKIVLRDVAVEAMMAKLMLDILFKMKRFENALFAALANAEETELVPEKYEVLLKGSFHERAIFIKNLFASISLDGEPASEEAFLRLFTDMREKIETFEKELQKNI